MGVSECGVLVNGFVATKKSTHVGFQFQIAGRFISPMYSTQQLYNIADITITFIILRLKNLYLASGIGMV